MRKKAPRLDKHVDKDVVLCSTTNRRVQSYDRYFVTGCDSIYEELETHTIL